VGNLRACCLPEKWSPFLRRAPQNRTQILCYSSTPGELSRSSVACISAGVAARYPPGMSSSRGIVTVRGFAEDRLLLSSRHNRLCATHTSDLHSTLYLSPRTPLSSPMCSSCRHEDLPHSYSSPLHTFPRHYPPLRSSQAPLPDSCPAQTYPPNRTPVEKLVTFPLLSPLVMYYFSSPFSNAQISPVNYTSHCIPYSGQ